MTLTIHRGTKEIGGTCIELQSGSSRIILDFGIPLVNRVTDDIDKDDFVPPFNEYLIKKGILPDIKGLYTWDNVKDSADAVLISHAHLDHYGLFSCVRSEIPVYCGEATKNLIELNGKLGNCSVREEENYWFIQNRKPFKVGSFKITPYLTDHSGYDAYMFYIEADDRSVLYTGDFRNHGRKSKSYTHILKVCPREPDVMITEGTNISSNYSKIKTETDIEREIIRISKETEGIVLATFSSQNIDRLVSFYRAAIQADRILLVDINSALFLEEIHKLNNKIPSALNPDYNNIRLYYPWKSTEWIVNILGKAETIYRFKKQQITRDELVTRKDWILLTRANMLTDFNKIRRENDEAYFKHGSFVYSLWRGYIDKDWNSRNFQTTLKYWGVETHYVHTSGHATRETLEELIETLKPKAVLPVHTLNSTGFKDFDCKVLEDITTMKIK